MAYLLTVDVGTGGCKTILFNSNGKVVAQQYAEYPTYILGSELIEQEPNEWWEATCNGIRQVLKTAKVSPEEVLGIGCGGHFPTMVLVDKDGNALRRAIIYSDMRAKKQTKELLRKCGPEICGITGLPESIFPGLPITKLLWIRENEPKIASETRRVMGAKDFINFRLTESVAVDYFEACWTGLANSRDYSWMSETADELSLSREWFGEIRRPQEVIGEVTERSSAKTGLKKGTPVICGSGDGMCNVIGSGLLEAGVTMESAGATAIIASVSNHPLPSSSEWITSWRHPDFQNWISYTSTSSAGFSLKWFKNVFARSERQGAPPETTAPYSVLDELAQEAQVGSGNLIFMPYLAGEYSPFFDLNARGVFLGISLETERRHMVRAVLEGVAFSLRHVLECMEQFGIDTEVIRTSGGGSRSRLWNQIKSDVTGKPVETLEVAETGCLGAAILTSVGIGEYPNFDEATQSMVRVADTILPNSENRERYSKLFEIYKGIYANLKETFSRIATL